jgi:VanZ family protein
MPWRTALAWTWTLAILAVCWLPHSAMTFDEGASRPFLIPHFDKVVHAGIFAGFAFLWAGPAPSKGRMARLLAAGVALAAISEVGQTIPFVNRDASWMDGLADVVGVVTGLAGASFLGGRRGARTPSAETP